MTGMPRFATSCVAAICVCLALTRTLTRTDIRVHPRFVSGAVGLVCLLINEDRHS